MFIHSPIKNDKNMELQLDEFFWKREFEILTYLTSSCTWHWPNDWVHPKAVSLIILQTSLGCKLSIDNSLSSILEVQDDCFSFIDWTWSGVHNSLVTPALVKEIRDKIRNIKSILGLICRKQLNEGQFGVVANEMRERENHARTGNNGHLSLTWLLCSRSVCVLHRLLRPIFLIAN